MFDVKLLVKLSQPSVDKFSTVLRDDDMQYPKPAHNVFSNKILDILCSDGRQGFDLYPFSEIIYVDQ